MARDLASYIKSSHWNGDIQRHGGEVLLKIERSYKGCWWPFAPSRTEFRKYLEGAKDLGCFAGKLHLASSSTLSINQLPPFGGDTTIAQ
jgi:hypothetical protein